MTHKNISRILFSTVLSCCLISSVSAMEAKTGPRGYTSFAQCANAWLTLAVPLAGITAYTLRYDSKFLVKLATAAKETLLPVTPKTMLVTYPSLAAAGIVAYQYYQPRVSRTYYYSLEMAKSSLQSLVALFKKNESKE